MEPRSLAGTIRPATGVPLSKLTAFAAQGIAIASAVEALDAGAPARLVQLLPMGEFSGRDGRGPWRLRDEAHANQVVAATRATLGKTDFAIDYDHQTMFAAKDGVGGRAPASGWIKPESLVVKPDGIWGAPEWTPTAAQQLKDRDYRYLSPVFGHDKQGNVTRLLNAALTNNPAIEELAAVAASNQGTPMDLKAIAKALGLSEDATAEQIAAAAAELRTSRDHLLATASALGLGADATGEAIVAAAKAGANPDPAKFVPIQSFTELQATVTSLQADKLEEKAVAAVDAATIAGKVPPSLKGWALDYARKDLAGFETYVATAAVIVPPSERQTGKTPPAETDVLTDDEKAICATLGVTEAAFLETKKQEAR